MLYLGANRATRLKKVKIVFVNGQVNVQYNAMAMTASAIQLAQIYFSFSLSFQNVNRALWRPKVSMHFGGNLRLLVLNW